MLTGMRPASYRAREDSQINLEERLCVLD